MPMSVCVSLTGRGPWSGGCGAGSGSGPLTACRAPPRLRGSKPRLRGSKPLLRGSKPSSVLGSRSRSARKIRRRSVVFSTPRRCLPLMALVRSRVRGPRGRVLLMLLKIGEPLSQQLTNPFGPIFRITGNCCLQYSFCLLTTPGHTAQPSTFVPRRSVNPPNVVVLRPSRSLPFPFRAVFCVLCRECSFF